MDSFSVYMPMDRRHALAASETLPEHTRGTVLITDISGFTTLTEALVTALGFQRGAEELSDFLNKVYGFLIAEVHRFHGSIVLSGGDALISWFDGPEKESAHRAVSAAFAMKESLKNISSIPIPGEGLISLAIKSAAASGEIHRFLVGKPEMQVYEVLAGSLLDKLDMTEKSARRGEVVVTTETARLLSHEASGIERRQASGGLSVSVIGSLNQASDPNPWPPSPTLSKEQARPWLHPFIYEYINSGQEMFMAQLRPSIALFMHFDGIDYENDGQAGRKLDMFFQWVQKDVERYGGTLVDITTGDKGSYFYITVGTPYAHEDDATRAVRLAQALLNLPDDLGFIHNIQIGITRGTIWSGSIGQQDWRTFGAHGNEVNLAARLMQAAQPGHMLVSERIAEATGNNYQWQLLREISVKGILKPVKVYEAITSRTASHASKLSLSTTIVGREAERMLLNEMLHNTNADSSKVVIIEGEAGIGKSRLASDLLSSARSDGIPALIGAGYAIEQSTAYHAWRPVFDSIFGLETVEDSEHRREKALNWIKQNDENLLDRVPLLAPVLSLDVQDNSLTQQMTGQVRAENTRVLLIAVLNAFIGKSPTLLVLEDTHWFDSPSLALTADATRSLTHVMILISTRPMSGEVPEHLRTILDLPQTRQIRLEQMDQRDITTLVCQRLGVSSLPEPVADLILNKAEGHPFFSEELAYSLLETGTILRENGECRVAPNSDLRALNFPDTVQGVVRSRIDRLVPSHQLALKAASVMGRIFALRAVSEIYPIDTDRPLLGDYFEHLRRLDLTPLNSETPDLSYLFKHVITQEVAYNLMPFSQRQRFHEAAAMWYEHTFTDDLSPYYAVLAYHWGDARNPQKAMEYLEKAGEQAMLNFANREVVDFFNEAIRLSEKGEVNVSALRRAHWERQLAEAFYGLSDLPRSLAHLKKAIHHMGWKTPEAGAGLITALLGEVFKQVRFRMKPKPIENTRLPGYLDDTQQAKLLEGAIAFVRLGHIYYQMNQPILLIFGNVQGINLAEASGLKSPILARCYTNMCIASGVLPRHDWAIAYRDRAHTMGREVKDLPSLAYALSGCGVYEVGAALWEDAARHFSEAMEIDARIGDQRHLDESKSCNVLYLYHTGEVEQSLKMAQTVYESAAPRGDIQPQVWSLISQAEALLRLGREGDLETSITKLEQALVLLSKNIDLANEIRALGSLAWAQLRIGRIQRAIELASDTAKKCAKSSPTAPYMVDGYAGVAEVFLSLWSRGEDEHRASAQKACKQLKKFAGVFPVGVPRFHLLQGWFNWLDGKTDRARRDWEKALAEAERLKMPYEQGRALLYLSEYILSGEEKVKAWTRASELFTSIGVQYEAEEMNTLAV